MLPYTAEILRLSSEIPHLGTLPPPAVTVAVVSPVCGSRLTLSARVAAGRIDAFAWEIEACALGQASAALIGARALGWGVEEVNTLFQALETLLKTEENLPEGFLWLTPLIPARAVPRRHGSILLPVRAFQRALSSSTGRM